MSTILSSSAFLQFSNVHLDSSPIEVQRADVLYDFLQMPTNAGKSGSECTLGSILGRTVDGVSGTLGFPLERRVSLVPVTMLISAVGVNRTLLRRLLGGWAFALAFRREVFASLDVSNTAATSLPPSRRFRLNGSLLHELLLVTRLARLLETNLRAEPCETHYATDASPSGAGGCFASVTREDWLALYDLAEEKREHCAP